MTFKLVKKTKPMFASEDLPEGVKPIELLSMRPKRLEYWKFKGEIYCTVTFEDNEQRKFYQWMKGHWKLITY